MRASDPRGGTILAPGFRYDAASGRVENGVGGIVAPNAREIWISESRGLFRLAPSGGTEIVGPAGEGGSASVSEDGTSSAFIRDRRLIVSYRGGPFRDAALGRSISDALWSPDGRHLALTECFACGAIVSDTRLDLYDAETGSLTFFYEPPAPVSYGDLAMSLQIDGLSSLIWSPDGRYLAGLVQNWTGRPDEVNAALNDARELLVFDTLSARTWSLGRVIDSGVGFGLPNPWFVWGRDHSLAYVSGDKASTWSNKTLRVWTPEGGSLDVAHGGVYSPSWDRGGGLYFARTTSPLSTPKSLLTIGPSETAVEKIDLAGNRIHVADVPQLHAIRASRDGSVLLYSATDQIGIVVDGRAISLLVFGAGTGYVMTPSLAWLAWDR